MAKNELVPGEPRLGWFIDGDASTPDIAVMLRDTGSAIELTIPLQGTFGLRGPYGRWWSEGMKFGDDPDRSRHSYAPPNELLVEDADGTVVLVGCRPLGSTSSFSAGRGRIVANFAVLGGRRLNYDKVHGIRTGIPGLAAWTNLSNIRVGMERYTNGRVKSVEMNLSTAEPLKLARNLNLCIRPNWHTKRSYNSFQAFETVALETTVAKPRTWNDHLQIHLGVADLLSIAAWQPFGFASTQVMRRDDPTRDAAGHDHGEKWSTVVSHRLPQHTHWKKEPRFLFPWEEVGPRGISRWLKLRTSAGRAIGPLINVLRSDNPWSHASVVQSGIALESLGYYIDVTKNNGTHLNGRKQMNYKPGLQVILNDLGMEPFDDIAGWIARSNDCYMGSKHPDRPEPDSLITLNTLRQNLIVLRCWIGRQLGVSVGALVDSLETDPLTAEFLPG